MAGPRGEYRKSARRRAEIIDAASLVFARHGYTASSMSEIAREVGLSQTGVLHHFSGGKIALLRAVLERRDAASEATLAHLHGRAFLQGVVEISRVQERQRGLVQLYRIISAEASDPGHPAHAYFKERISRIADALTAVISEIGDNGGLRPGVDPRAAALRSIVVMEGLEVLWLADLEVEMDEDLRAFFNEILVEPI